MYTVTEGPNTQQPVVTVHQGVYGNIQTYRYPYDPREAPSHTELYDTMQNSEYNVSIPERACAFPTNTANELLTGKVYEMGTVVGLAGIRSAPYGVGDSEVIQEARATGIDVKIVDYGIQYALGSKYNIRQNIIEAQKVPPTGGIAYITYQSATSKPKASSDTEE
jgi:hypothetical protein